ncbi:MAG: type II toxin-antitoxin system VapC family toxin [Saprospiraceae bacterium]|nr:type II toxin-antitoxin system VapC family toxin [Saprospiraceae bacterium]
MNGRFLLDTNAVIALLKGNDNIAFILTDANWVGISVITELEFLSFPDLSVKDESIFNQFISRVEVLGVDSQNPAFIGTIIQIRKQNKIKLPDAIIAATALYQQATLISNDDVLFKIPDLLVRKF